MPVFGFFWRESFEARKKRLAARGSGLGFAGSQNSLPTEFGPDYMSRAASVCRKPGWPGCHVIAKLICRDPCKLTVIIIMFISYIAQSNMQ